MTDRAKTLLNWCLSKGDTIGKLVSFFGLPAVLIGAVAYSQEIRDTFSEPNVAAKIDLVSIRCAYVFRSTRQVRDYNSGDDSVLTEVCDAAPTSASFGVTFTNQDSILRTVVDLQAEVTIPSAGTLDLKLARQQIHQVVGIAETQVRQDWTPLEIRAGRDRWREAWIEPIRTADAMQWVIVRGLLNSGAYSNETQIFRFHLFAEFERWSDPVHLAACNLTMEPEQVVRFNAKPPHRQIQITISCDPIPRPKRTHRSRRTKTQR